MKLLKALLSLVLLSCLAGCAGYRVGSTLPESIQTVSLSVINNTEEPSIEVAVIKALRAELQMDGRLKVVSPDESDTTLRVTLNRYELVPLAFDRRKGSLAVEYRILLQASSVLYDTKTEKVIQEQPVLSGDSDFPFAGDLTSSKRAGLPRAANLLARKVVVSTLTAW